LSLVFCPDPSICRVGDAYYLVNSSFLYFPGLPSGTPKISSIGCPGRDVGNVCLSPLASPVAEFWRSSRSSPFSSTLGQLHGRPCAR
jgi:hypothetical protein